MTSRATAAFRRLEELSSRRAGALLLFALSLFVYAVRAIGWPLATGRDLDEYLLFYVQMWEEDPLLPWSLLFRTPVTPIVVGPSLDIAGGFPAEPVAAVFYGIAVVAWSAAAVHFGRRVALVTAAALLAYPGYALIFHELSSEFVMATVFAVFAYAFVRAATRPSAARFAIAGVVLAVLVLTRPGNAVLLALALFPLALGIGRRRAAAAAAAFAAAAVLPLAAWSLNNGLRYGEYTLARGGNAIIPFYRVFITDRLVSPENGPASRRLAAAVERHLVTREPYRSYGVTVDEVFSSGSFRIHEDMYTLSDRVWGWDSDYAILRDAGLEAVREHPGAYASGVLATIWDQLSETAFRTAGLPQAAPSPRRERGPAERGDLPAPTEGEPIPAGQSVWISRPDQSIREVWTSPTRRRFVFRDPADQPRFNRIVSAVETLLAALPDRRANADVGLRLNQASRWFPRPVVWLAIGAAALALRRTRGATVLAALALAALLVVGLNALGLFADPHFVLPVAPAFVLFGVGALLGSARRALAVPQFARSRESRADA